MTFTTISEHRAIPHDRKHLVKEPDREWLRAIAAFALLGGIMATLMLGPLALGLLLRGLLTG
ncbi:MAG: hypothetical protein ACXW2I_04295 [Burkholderiales bacterium]